MPKEYCPSCGLPTDYITNAPKFCASCGKPFNFAAAAQSILARTAPAVRRQRPQEEDEEPEQFFEVERPVRAIKKLDIVIGEISDPRQSLQDVATEAPVGGFVGRKAPKMSHKKALAGIFNKAKPVDRNSGGIEVGE